MMYAAVGMVREAMRVAVSWHWWTDPPGESMRRRSWFACGGQAAISRRMVWYEVPMKSARMQS